MEIDAALAINPRQLLRDLFIFHGNEAGQHFDDGDFGAEGTEDGGEFHADCAGANNHQRFGHLLEREDLDVAEDAVSGFQAREHAGFRSGSRGLHFWP